MTAGRSREERPAFVFGLCAC